jgi:predicted dehydrogenase
LKRVNIAGFGLIGKERARAIVKLREKGHDVELGLVHDPFVIDKAGEFDDLHFRLEPDFQTFLDDSADLWIIACPHDVAADYARKALKLGKHILLEKPMGRNLQEAKTIIDTASEARLLNVGFNYRFMGGVRALLRDVQDNRFGELISVTMQQGHGGRPGDEKTWKLDPVRCGGGALLDPGVHMIDLACLMSNPKPIQVRGTAAWNGFWKTGIEEDVYALLTADNVMFGLHISVVLWRSSFYIHVLGTEGYGIIRGRGRSYGPQTYTRGQRWGWRSGVSQPESEEVVITTDCEESFEDELAALLGLSSGRDLCAEDSAALKVMEIHDNIRKMLG